MLAYIFWHWPQSQVTAEEYKKRLADYHRTLQRVGSPGFLYSAAFEFEGAPWLASQGKAYTDWYLVEGSAALDPLNETAVGEACLETHNAIARYTENGTAGLYHLQTGELNQGQALYEVWFSKPPTLRYAELYRVLEPLTSQAGVNLWQRHMTLGPATEFCLSSTERQVLPEELSGLYLALNPVF
jgi:hypothetical protein